MLLEFKMHCCICMLDNSFKLYIYTRTTIKLIYVNLNSDYSVFSVVVYIYKYGKRAKIVQWPR